MHTKITLPEYWQLFTLLLKNYNMETKTSSTLSDFIEALAYEKPNEVISTFKDEINVYTISELNKKANLLAKGLLYNGVEKGTNVALVLAGTTNCLTFVMAVLKIGAILIPINKYIGSKNLETILIHEKVHSLAFYADAFLEKLKEIIPDYFQNERGYLQNEKFPCLKNIITLGSIKNRGLFTSRELMLLGMHMDDIEMETRIKTIMPNDVFMKHALFDENEELSVNKKTHKEIITPGFSFPALQNFLMNTI